MRRLPNHQHYATASVGTTAEVLHPPVSFVIFVSLCTPISNCSPIFHVVG